MADSFTFSYEGQVIDTAVQGEILDTISRKSVTVNLAADQFERQTLIADNVTENDLVVGVTLPAVVLVQNRDAVNALLIGPKQTGVMVPFITVHPTTSWPFAIFVLDATAILRYKSVAAPVNFYLRAWPI